MVVLVCGLVDDPPVTLLIDSLQRKGADYVFIDQESMAGEVQMRWQLTDNGIAGHLKVGKRVVGVHEILSVYHRFVKPEDLPGASDSPETVKKTRSVLHSLSNLLDILPIRMVNRRRPMMSNNSKPYQALLIRQAGFATPKTLITNDFASFRDFASTRGPLIYKSISSVRSIVAALNGKSAGRIESLRYLPTQFQRKIEGFNLRVHVIGRRLFATRIRTSATDYRYALREGASLDLVPYEVTADLRKKCLRLARIFQLAFSGIDLIVNPENVYCLEVNPSPAYSFYQNATGQPISDALADYLTRNPQKPSTRSKFG